MRRVEGWVMELHEAPLTLPPLPSHITLTNRAKYANWPDVIDGGKFYGRAV